MTRAGFLDLLRRSASAWTDDRAASMGAALAYYTLFSIAPLVVLAVALASFVFGREVAQAEALAQLRELLGEQGAQAVATLLHSAANPADGRIAAMLGVAGLLLGASSVFGELQSALDRIWKLPPPPPPVGLAARLGAMLRQRLPLFAMVLGMGLLLLLAIMASAVLAALGKFGWHGAGADWLPLLRIANHLVGFGLVTLLFALVYKVLPRSRLAWRDVWIGALLTAVLFSIGRALIGLYLGRFGGTSVFGAAGALVLVLVWVYWSAQVFLFGAEFTHLYAREYGSLRDPDAPTAAA